MLLLLDDANDASGAKAATLARLRAAAIPVPDGFVIPAALADDQLESAVDRGLGALGRSPVAVRSSSLDEDGAHASSAGQYLSVLGVSGADAVVAAVRACRSSAHSDRARAYRGGADAAAMPVLVQRMVDAESAGVMFAPLDVGQDVIIEAARGLGVSVVEGRVDPDGYAVDAGGAVRSRIRGPHSRVDAGEQGLVESPVARSADPTLDVGAARDLAGWGRRIAALLGSAQDIEWAIADSTVAILQARPVTAALPPWDDARSHGIPGSPGRATGSARIVDGPEGFGSVRPGDVLICHTTDPGWTPLLRTVAAVVTETGGVLSHAAIVAREFGIPAVLGVRGARQRFAEGRLIVVDGSAGTVSDAG